MNSLDESCNDLLRLSFHRMLMSDDHQKSVPQGSFPALAAVVVGGYCMKLWAVESFGCCTHSPASNLIK